MAARIIVSVKEAGSLSRALKNWKRKSFFILKELKERKQFKKKSEKKREARAKAIDRDQYLINQEK